MDTSTSRPEVDMGDILIDQFKRLCSTFSAHEGAGRGDEAIAAALWVEIDRAGFPNALVPEDLGGYGVTPEQAMALVRAAAALALPIPLAETMIVRALHAATAGPLIEGALAWGCDVGTARDTPEGWRVTATARAVPFGRVAGSVVLPVSCNGVTCLARLPGNQACVQAHHNLAGEARDTLTWQGVLVSHDCIDAGVRLGVDVTDLLLVAGAFIRSQQMVGAMQQALDQAVAYARERQQFGQPIGRFQAVQHQLAVAFGQLAAASAAADAATEAYGSAAFALATAVAKSRVGEAAGVVASTCHQVLGAMGFTREHALHTLTRRLWAWRDEYGGESLWQERIGRTICSCGADELWQTVVEGFAQERGEGSHG